MDGGEVDRDSDVDRDLLTAEHNPTDLVECWRCGPMCAQLPMPAPVGLPARRAARASASILTHVSTTLPRLSGEQHSAHWRRDG
jgi:hypothetical protein